MSDDLGYDLSQFKATYFEECAELLASAEETLSRLQDGSGTVEDLNAVFRCVHSIKGGAGAFSFDDLVHFAHVFETAMDALRSGRAEPSPQLAELLMRGNDVLGDFVRAAQEGVSLASDHGADILAQLAAITEGGPVAPLPAKAVAPQAAPAAPPPAVASVFKCYKIAFQPTLAMLRTGNDPLLMIRELAALGDLDVAVDRSRMPSLTEMDPQAAYLSWTFTLTTDKDRQAIADVFEFVDGDTATITIEEIQGAEEGDGWGLFAPLPTAAPAAGASQAGDVEGDGWGLFAPQSAPAAEQPAKPASVPATAAPTPAAAAGGQVHTTSIRVDLDKVDRLVNMVGELVITQAMLGQQAIGFSVESHPELIQGLQELSHHTRELQESVMAIRAQPVKALFSKAPRLVRDLSSKLGKQARLVMSGENTEVDKTVIEQLSDPLTHLIRNALDHGLETPEERMAVGKPTEGTIHLAAEHRSGRIIIEISDDGRGIDRKRVLEKAIDKGLVERGQQLTDEQVDMLIFAPGFSTASEVSDVSGRGVGMDVVRKNIQDVGGRVVVQSTPGAGSRFILSLPLTLAVMDGMLVAIGGQRYVLPLTNIVESLRPAAHQARFLVDVGDVLTLRGEYIRLIPLHRLFGIGNAITDPTRGLVVVVETEGGDRVGLLVDELLGQQQVVIKSLDANFRPVEGISAATILGDGRVALILDVGALRVMGERLTVHDRNAAAAE
ncbi:chemotaxis protein CheA [Magnetospirillum aberrantis]|uniref:Chemotaxis protein CheA n=1 Tax=Magnetospirillum aberrantis SpK TaxID=908842 RepID=A0A7C9V0V2_9PROT|nr:chemotaxis protein CheA [Magnetospirillum aberrantis]NFV81735.1 chemotaxis protein CheA [Magnetospirillum aberrantis SpK]